MPEARFLGIHRHTSVPRVLSLEEGRRFLDACDTLNRHRSSPRRELVLRTLLVLLYLTGLRAGEALRLTQADIDLETAVLRIRDTKFGKSLARYPVPEFMASTWWCRDNDGAAYRELYVHVARGNNPRTGPTPVPLTRRVAHHFLQAPAHCTIKGAVRWGQVMALGGTPALADACVATPLGEGFDNDAFWLSVIRWFIAHPTFDLAQVGPAVDFIEHIKARQPGFSTAGRTPDALLREAERWHAALGHNRGIPLPVRDTWPTRSIRGLCWETTGRRNTTAWTIEELLSYDALVQEGRETGHCVASYAGRCGDGECSIWSVKAAAGDAVMERWTVEVSRRRVILQVRGKSNAPARGDRGASPLRGPGEAVPGRRHLSMLSESVDGQAYLLWTSMTPRPGV